ncbi:MAG: TolC family protein, partial [Synergistaceae bacterium]|nr:TolC family protein [Synergistaceae bacterium]
NSPYIGQHIIRKFFAWAHLTAALIFIFAAVLFTVPAFSSQLSLDLNRAYEIAIENSKNIKAAESDIAKANEERRQAHGARGVTVTIEHDTARIKYQNDTDVSANSFQNVISATYPLYTGGLIESSIAAAEYELQSKKLSLERSRQDVKLSAATAFFTMLRTEDMAKLASDAVERLEVHLRNVEAQYRNGKVSKADLLRSEVELINARQEMGQAMSEHSVAVKNMNSVMGLPLDTELSHDGKMSYRTFDDTLRQCLEHALSHHPDIAVAELLEKKAEAGIGIAKSEKKPKVTIAASQTLLSANMEDSLSNWPGLEDENFEILLHAEYTFSDGGVSSSKIRGAREDLKKAVYNRESARDAITMNVTQYFMEMEEAKSRIETGHLALDKAQESYRISLARYREGVGTNLDVLDAQTALNQANSNHTQAFCDYNIALARLENALGTPIAAKTK